MSDFAEQLVMSELAEADDAKPTQQPEPSSGEPAGDGRARDEQGRFVAKTKDEDVETGVKEEAAPPAQAAQPQPEPPTGDEGKHVPLAALKALKQTLAEREAELAELRKPKQEQPQKAPTQPEPHQNPTSKRPDFTFDESQFEDTAQLFNARLHKTRMDMSLNFADSQFGEDAVNEAWEAFDQAANTDPRISAFSESLINHPHPMGEIVKWHRQQKEISQLTEAGGLEKLREKLRAELLAEMQGQQPAAAPAVAAAPAAVPLTKPATAAPPPSLAKGGAGATGAVERPSDEDVFEAIFDKSKRQSRKR